MQTETVSTTFGSLGIILKSYGQHTVKIPKLADMLPVSPPSIGFIQNIINVIETIK